MEVCGSTEMDSSRAEPTSSSVDAGTQIDREKRQCGHESESRATYVGILGDMRHPQ